MRLLPAAIGSTAAEYKARDAPAWDRGEAAPRLKGGRRGFWQTAGQSLESRTECQLPPDARGRPGALYGGPASEVHSIPATTLVDDQWRKLISANKRQVLGSSRDTGAAAFGPAKRRTRSADA